jgi:benzoate/toluate 1,2-dioxygenase beta subunit
MSGDVLASVAALVHAEARLLDERRFEDWAALFAPDGFYWVPLGADQTDPARELSIFADDTAQMAARIRRLRHPRAHAETPPSRAVRAVSNLELAPPPAPVGHAPAPGTIGARSVLTFAEWRDGAVRVTLARIAWALVPAPAADSGLLIRLKRVDLVDAEGTHGILTVPF